MITYNNTEVLQGHPSPLISKSKNYEYKGDVRILERDSITLRGELTGCNSGDLVTARNSILTLFSDNFKNLDVSGVGVFTGVRVESIAFDQSPYLQTLPYTITMSHYPSGGFQVAYGVSEPTNQWSYTEQEDQTLQITQEVSARGVNTEPGEFGGNALDNAKNFVTSQLTGAWEIPRPYLIDTKDTNFKCYLTSFNTNIDKMSNTVSATRSFRTDPTDLEGNIILRYNQQVEQAEGERVKISYDGVIDAGVSGYITNAPSTTASNNLSGIRDRYEEFKSSIDASVFLNERVTEDTEINRLTFGLTFYSGDNEPNIIDDFTITLQEDSNSSLVSVSINGTISPKEGCLNTGNLANIKAFYDGPNHKYQICEEIYKEFYTIGRGCAINKPSEVFLNEKALTTNQSINENLETLTYTTNYNDRNLMNWNTDDSINSVDYNISYQPSLKVITATPSASNGGFIYQDLGYSTNASISVDVNSNQTIPEDEYDDFVKSQSRKMTTNKKDFDLDSESYSQTRAESSSFKKSLSFQSNNDFVDGNFTGINEFKL